VGRCGLDTSYSEEGPLVGTPEHGNEPSGSIKGGEFLDQFSDCYLIEKDYLPWS
jgi:hypothetical protein